MKPHELLAAVEAEIHGPPVRTAYVISRLGGRFPRAVIRTALLELLRAGRIERIIDENLCFAYTHKRNVL